MHETCDFVGLTIAFVLFSVGVILITLELAPIHGTKEDKS